MALLHYRHSEVHDHCKDAHLDPSSSMMGHKALDTGTSCLYVSAELQGPRTTAGKPWTTCCSWPVLLGLGIIGINLPILMTPHHVTPLAGPTQRHEPPVKQRQQLPVFRPLVRGPFPEANEKQNTRVCHQHNPSITAIYAPKQDQPAEDLPGFFASLVFLKGSFRARDAPAWGACGVRSAPRTSMVGFRIDCRPALRHR